jgi:uncharacterized protein YkwD
MSNSQTTPTVSVRLLTAALALAALVLLAAAPGTAQAAECKGADNAPSQLKKDRAEHIILCLINRERADHGLGDLRKESAQAKAARKHTKLMVRQRCFSHQCSGEGDLVARVERTNYLPCNCYWGVGENLAYGEGSEGSPRSLFKAWMNSAPHRANIINGRYEHIGIGIVWGTPTSGSQRGSATYTTTFGYRD